MKNKNKITIKNKIQYAPPDIYGIVSSFVFTFGVVASVCASFASLKDYTLLFGILGGIFSSVLVITGSGKKNYAVYIFPAVILLFCAVFFSRIREGILSMGNDFLSFLSTVDGKIHLKYAVEDTSGAFTTGILLSAVIAYFSFVTVLTGKIFPMVTIIIAGILCSYTGLLPSGWEMAVFFISMVFTFVYVLQKKGGIRGNIKGILTQTAVIALAVLISLSGIMLPVSLFEKIPAEELARSRHDEKYHISTPSMPEGDLDNLPAFDKNATAALRISMEYPQKMYLKGMVGEVYTGLGWEELGNDVLAEYDDLFFWLYKYGYFPQSSVAGAAKLTDENTEEYIMNITSLASCRENIYVPYALSGNDILDSTLIGGSEVYVSEDSLSNTYSYTKGSVPEWYMTQSALSASQGEAKTDEYLRYEESYRDFVYENYLQISNEAVGVLDRVLGTEKKQRTLAEIRKSIFDTLEENLSYDESVVTKNSGNDFFRYFMEQTRSGYSVHYATAAVLMLRYYGVPARYVEGYFLPADEAEDYEPSETIILTEAHSHAWAEYYLDGTGWIPFEVTPGYVDDEELKLSGESAANQQIYDRNELKYTPPIQQEERQPLSNWRDLFSVKKEHIILILTLILLIFIIRTLIRRSRLKKALGAVEHMDNKDAIKTLYGYAVLLSSKLESHTEDERIRLINRKAMFSLHEMTDEELTDVKNYLEEVKITCSQSWKMHEKIKYRFVDCIYL